MVPCIFEHARALFGTVPGSSMLTAMAKDPFARTRRTVEAFPGGSCHVHDHVQVNRHQVVDVRGSLTVGIYAPDGWPSRL
eukprot:4203217-Alexandrium_andersonii.AAC.1